MKLRKSKLRNKLLSLLKNTEVHPTASWLYDRLKEDFSNLSLGTVYRNLRILTEQGEINELDFGSTFDRYEAKITPHYHFICEKCGSVYDVELPILNDLNVKVEDLMNCKTTKHRIEFYGICKNCM